MAKIIEIRDNEDLVYRLKNITVMKILSDSEFAEMLKLSKIMQYAPREIIIKEGYFDNRIYFLISGRVEISKEDQQLNILESTGDTFGEMSVIQGLERSATIVSLEPTTCLSIDASFAERLRRDHKLNLLDKIFTEVLAARLRTTTDEYTHTLNQVKRLKKENAELRQLISDLKTLLDRHEKDSPDAADTGEGYYLSKA